VFGIVHRAGGAGEVEDVVHRPALDRMADVSFLELETRVGLEMFDVRSSPGEQVIDRHDRVTFSQ
jgi:hypothetical protein